MADVLIIDDDRSFCRAAAESIQRAGHGVSLAHTIEEGRARAAKTVYDVVFLDVHLPDGSGLDLLPELRVGTLPPEVIIVTGYGDAHGAELAIQHDAWDYLGKDTGFSGLKLSLTRALQYRESRAQAFQRELFDAPELVGTSAALRTALSGAARAAGSDASVVVTGETGTGKELCALSIHRNSRRAKAPFVVVDCAALPDSLIGSVLFGHERGAFTGAERRHIGLIRQADGGTLFLDEIAELPMEMQKALLRVLQERQFCPIGSETLEHSDFRVIAATNRNLEQRVEEGLFRQDLLFRLRGLTVEMPPLRERMEDIPALCSYFVEEECRILDRDLLGVGVDVLEQLAAYDWPGNVRELRQALTAAVVAAGTQQPALYAYHLPLHVRLHNVKTRLNRLCSAPGPEACFPGESLVPDFSGGLPRLSDVREHTEKAYLSALIGYCDHDIEAACQISGISRPHVYKLLKKHGLKL